MPPCPPWRLTGAIAQIVSGRLASLGRDYRVKGDIGVHETARIEEGAVVKGPAIIGPTCFILPGMIIERLQLVDQQPRGP
ncbi:MAG: hypothetical protein ACHQAQ_09375 [Hyphomicrobiales bacterium]